ncbi:MAG TPA: O-antigen ligase family protein [Burkholderiales bacterium]|nr:O-antigen ligase family protein [Burkholderiales bacterium]
MNSDADAPRLTGLITYATIATAIVALLLLTNWPTYQYEVRGGPIPLYFYALPAVLIIPMLFADPGSAVRFLRDPLFWWFVVFVVIGLFSLLLAQDFMENAARQWRLRLLALMFFYTITILASGSQRRLIGWVMVGCVLLACALCWFDVLRPGRIVPQGIEGSSERGAGLFINPNIAGSFIVMGTIAALPMIPSRLRGLLLVAAVFGVAGTFSRGAFVMVTIAMAGMIWLKLVKRAQGMVLVLALPVLVGGVSLAYDYAIDTSENRHVKGVVERLNWFRDTAEEDSAVEGRKWGAKRAWEAFLDSPAIGNGIGATSLAVDLDGPHNMYLMLMAEHGIFGFLLYISLCALLVRQGRSVARWARSVRDRDIGNSMALFGMALAVYGFFSHNVLEDPFTVFLMAFLTAAAFGARRVATADARRYVRPRTVARDAATPV